MPKIWRYVVPVDDEWHAFALTGPVLAVEPAGEYKVGFWAIAELEPGRTRHFRIFGTDQELPTLRHKGVPALDVIWRGTVRTPSGNFAWHLMERQCGTTPLEKP